MEVLAQHESEFRTLVENSPDPIARYDRECRCIYCNPALVESSMLAATALLGKTPVESSPFPPSAAKAYTALIRQVLDNAQPGEIEVHWERQGAPACLQLRVIPERDDNGQVVSALAVGRDVSVLKQAEMRLHQSHDFLRALALHREGEREEERRRLAHEIHEDLAQNLMALCIYISLLEKDAGSIADSTLPSPLLQSMRDIAERSIVRIRDMVSMLRPTALELGIVPALHWLTEDFSKGVGLKIGLALPEDVHLDDKIATFLFRATEKALVNTTLHGAASHAHVSLKNQGGFYRLVVRDNGCGFDTAAPYPQRAFGLFGLAEQAQHLGGELSIDSTPTQGTTLTIQVPAMPPPLPGALQR